jgi:hypothetical protein
MTDCLSLARAMRRHLPVQLGGWMVVLGLWWSQ